MKIRATTSSGFLLWLVPLVLIAGLAWFFIKNPKAGEQKEQGVPAVPVVVAKVEQRNTPVVISVIGRAEAHANVTVQSRVDGQVIGNDFKEGQPVKKGQVLVRLDPATFIAQLKQAEANQAKSQAQLLKVQADMKRYQNLFGQGFISEAQLNQTQADLKTAEASAQSDAAALDNSRLTLSYATIRAPMDGIVGAIQVYPGGIVRSNDTALLVINQVQPMYVSFSIPEVRLAELKASLARGPVAVSATLPNSDSTLKGQVAFINNAVDVNTGTLLVKAVFDNPNNLLTPGQFINVSMEIDQIQNALVLPSSAIQTNPKGNFVYVVKADQTVDPRPVTVSMVLGDLTVVQGGLTAGETVVTDGQLRLKPGSKVKASTTPAGTTPNDIPKLTS